MSQLGVLTQRRRQKAVCTSHLQPFKNQSQSTVQRLLKAPPMVHNHAVGHVAVGGEPLVAPETPVPRPDGVDSQRVWLLPPVLCREVSQGCSRPALPPLLSNILRQEAFQGKRRPGTGYALWESEAVRSIHGASNQ
jgi:hypothetical protein